MPRISGRSSLTTTSPIRLRPSVRRVSRWLALQPIVDFFCSTLRRAITLATSARLRAAPPGDVLDRQATASRHGLGLLEHAQRLDGRVHDVDLVGRAERLAQDVVDAGALEHRTHRATGDDTGTGSGRTQQDDACGLLTLDRVRDGALDAGDLEESFLASSTPWRWPRDFLGLAVADADQSLAVADDTRAVKLKRRPPFTTLATRLIATTRSM